VAPGAGRGQDFTPDGSAVFTSPRAVHTGYYTQLFKVSTKGDSPEEQLKIPNASKAVYSPDGGRIAYNPLSEAFSQWKNYRGGTVSTISLFRLSDNSVEKIPQPEGRANDTDPMWIGDTVHFRSDRNGEFNLFSYDTKSKVIRQLTSLTDFPIVNASAGGGRITYEQAGHLHIFDPASGRSKRLVIAVGADFVERGRVR
jgi:tricorn protease